jgi:peptide/nickel transport system permease protein
VGEGHNAIFEEIKMLKYLSGRTGQALLVLWAAFTLSFILLQVLPGDAILIKFQNPDMGLSPAQIAEMRTAYGADVPLWQQYLHTLSRFLRGDLWYSIQNGVAVSALLAANLPATLQLAVLGFVLALLLALGIAFVSNLVGFGWLKSALQSLPALFVSVPTFWLGIVLIQIFSFRLKLIPIINPGEWVGLVLPIVTLAIPISAPLAQILIRSIDSVQTQPFVVVARAKGASHSGVLWRHVARNAMLPVLTIAGILLGELIAGALITETVFGRSGLGQLTQQAVVNQDVAVLQAVVMIAATAFVTLNLLVDLLFPLLDPRLKYDLGVTP